MKTRTIPAGYILTVISWENDGDNYNTVQLEGLSKAEARFKFDLADLCTGEFSNTYYEYRDDNKAFEEACVAVLKKHREFVEKAIGESIEELKYPMDFMSELLGDLGLVSEHFFPRVAEKITVEYIPAAIEIEDVTEVFKGS